MTVVAVVRSVRFLLQIPRSRVFCQLNQNSYYINFLGDISKRINICCETNQPYIALEKPILIKISGPRFINFLKMGAFQRSHCIISVITLILL